MSPLPSNLTPKLSSTFLTRTIQPQKVPQLSNNTIPCFEFELLRYSPKIRNIPRSMLGLRGCNPTHHQHPEQSFWDVERAYGGSDIFEGRLEFGREGVEDAA